MSKKPAAPSEAQPGLDIVEPNAAAEAEAQPGLDIVEPNAAAEAEAQRIATERAAESTGVLLRRENIAGRWYPHGAVLTCNAQLARALELDGALDLHPGAVANALTNGEPQLRHAADPRVE